MISKWSLKDYYIFTSELTWLLAFSISPGPARLVELMDPTQVDMSDSTKWAREKDLERYSLFPMYPTGKHSWFYFPLSI